MWQQIQANRRRSLIFLLVMIAILLALGYFAGETIAPHQGGPIGLLVALAIWAIQMLVYFTAAESILLGTAMAHELKRDDSPLLFNVVEEMKIASGLGYLPRIFLIDDPTPNAFAIGRSAETSALAVTTGLLQRLNRDELQGVIGHEIGHLKNADVKFMTLAAVMLGSIILLADVFWRVMRGAGRSTSRSSARGGGGQAQAILLVVALVLMILAPILAQLLYFACSRRREYLADASSAQFTRYPQGLASALGKIAGAQHEPHFANRVTAPMFIVNPLQADGDGAGGLFATHPPTSERIRILRSMAGAGFGDYETAFQNAKGRQNPLIAPNWTQLSAHEEIRASSDESEEGFALREVRTIVHRLDGYLTVACPCGLTTNVPTQYGGNDIHCVRCGRLLPLPTALEKEAGAEPAAASRAAAASEAPLQYVRKTSGWESFRCQCGRTIQLSPSFRAPHVSCSQCGRQIEIVGAESG